MIVVWLLLLVEPTPPAPAPTPTASAVVGRSTPVPAGGSLQDVARRRRGLSTTETSRPVVTVAEGTFGPVRCERLAARPAKDGLLVNGWIQNDTGVAARAFVEVHAMRRDGTRERGIALFDAPIDAGKMREFEHVLSGRTDPASPESLRSETAGARVHVLPDMSGSSPEYTNYLSRIECLSYWFKRTRSPGSKEDDQVEIHVLNNCKWVVRAADTWFELRATEGPSEQPFSTRSAFGAFLEDVPPRGELRQVTALRIPPGHRAMIVPFRLR